MPSLAEENNSSIDFLIESYLLDFESREPAQPSACKVR